MSIYPQWPVERIARFHRIHQAGKSAGLVAEALGVSRNAVLGWAHRNGISFAESLEHKPFGAAAPAYQRRAKNAAKSRIETEADIEAWWEART